jgi:hypothetical protein
MTDVYPTLDQFRRAALWKARPAEIAERESQENPMLEEREKEEKNE